MTKLVTKQTEMDMFVARAKECEIKEDALSSTTQTYLICVY